MDRDVEHYMRRSNRRKRSRGVAMLELAIVLPILIMLLLGIIEMGRVMMLNNVSTNAVREASRRAIRQGMTNAEVLSTVNGYLDAGGVSQTGRQVYIRNSAGASVDLTTIKSHQMVSVEVQLPYANNTWGFTSIMGAKTLVSKSKMRRE